MLKIAVHHTFARAFELKTVIGLSLESIKSNKNIKRNTKWEYYANIFDIFYIFICRSDATTLFAWCSWLSGTAAKRNFEQDKCEDSCKLTFFLESFTSKAPWVLKKACVCKRSSHHWCSIKNGFIKLLPNSQENTCIKVSFLVKLQAWGLQLY